MQLLYKRFAYSIEIVCLFVSRQAVHNNTSHELHIYSPSSELVQRRHTKRLSLPHVNMFCSVLALSIDVQSKLRKITYGITHLCILYNNCVDTRNIDAILNDRCSKQEIIIPFRKGGNILLRISSRHTSMCLYNS